MENKFKSLTIFEFQERFCMPALWPYKIIMDNNKIQTWVNGVLAVDTTDDMSASGFLGFQFHKAYRKWQVDKKVLWKNIKIKEL